MDSSQSVLLSKYLNQYQKNKRSRVFAPLAECYRKSGMLAEALQILREGLKIHRDYTLAYVVLAQCYVDEGKYINSFHVLQNIIEDNRDNIKLQKLFGQICYKLEKYNYALESLKYVLFYNPEDQEVVEKIQDIEQRINLENKFNNIDNVQKTEDSQATLDSWEAKLTEINSGNTNSVDTPLGDDSLWEMKKIAPEVQEEVSAEVKKEKSKLNEDEVFDTPIMTHTMVDIYLAQKHFDKAIELLERILEMNPNDSLSREKLLKIQRQVNPNLSRESEEKKDAYKLIERAFLMFNEKIKEKSELVLGSLK